VQSAQNVAPAPNSSRQLPIVMSLPQIEPCGPRDRFNWQQPRGSGGVGVAVGRGVFVRQRPKANSKPGRGGAAHEQSTQNVGSPSNSVRQLVSSMALAHIGRPTRSTLSSWQQPTRSLFGVTVRVGVRVGVGVGVFVRNPMTQR